MNCEVVYGDILNLILLKVDLVLPYVRPFVDKVVFYHLYTLLAIKNSHIFLIRRVCKPLMVYYIVDFDPVSWIGLKHTIDKINDFSRGVLLVC